jgi:hypothetical protein
VLLALGALALAGSATAAKPKPPPPKPKVELLTGTEQGVLRRGGIKVEVRSRRGAEARTQINMVVDGYPEDFAFRLGPKTGKLKGNLAKHRFKLSPRQSEVLDFAIKTCRGTTLAIRTQVGRGSATLNTSLRIPREC